MLCVDGSFLETRQHPVRALSALFQSRAGVGLLSGTLGGEGKGVVATCPMDKGDVVCDYHGTLISEAE
ncbi:hypothetical protein CgunFtcFv8_018759 [Champsocephalus gunnari]|uniref:Uncharacterized protein n=1 Tax=Champsocephalus gunnari TaxID=52237 RepID=A0AAN8BTD5_CHAGU|nr:hypothetical protein CgunFtcFv8_018759 [Champsocephalus gunnari]